MVKKCLRDNVGYTLVELVATIAVMAIVGGVITAFVVTVQKNYNSGLAEADLQYEAQLVTNQLQDLLMNSTRGISYSYSGTMADGSAISESYILADTDSDIADAEAVESKYLYVYDQTEYYVLEWKRSEKKIYFSSYDTAGNPIEVNQLLAEFVTDFSVDLGETAENNTLMFTLNFEKEGAEKAYTTSHKIKLRNEILINASLVEVYANV